TVWGVGYWARLHTGLQGTTRSDTRCRTSWRSSAGSLHLRSRAICVIRDRVFTGDSGIGHLVEPHVECSRPVERRRAVRASSHFLPPEVNPLRNSTSSHSHIARLAFRDRFEVTHCFLGGPRSNV